METEKEEPTQPSEVQDQTSVTDGTPPLSTFRLLFAHIGYAHRHLAFSSQSQCLQSCFDFVSRYDRCGTLLLFNAQWSAYEVPLTSPQTIVSTALPTIASDLHASKMQYTWVGVSYMLTQTALQPLYGRISDLVGRKVRYIHHFLHFNSFLTRMCEPQTVLHTSIAIFAVGSALCGAARVRISLSFVLPLHRT